MSRWGRGTGAAVAVVVAGATVWLSSLPMASVTSEDAVLRLAFRARPERIETCIEQSPEALAALPPHMRQTRICEGRTASYRLEVRRDGVLIAEHLVHGGGLRQDRPLYVFHEVPIPAGEASIAVRFERLDDATETDDRDKGREQRETEGGTSTRLPVAPTAIDGDLRQAVPKDLSLERRIRFEPRAVLLVSYDPDRRALYVVDAP